MAPVWHRWMLWSAPHGLGIHRVFTLCLANLRCDIATTKSTIYIHAMCEEMLVSDPTLSVQLASIWEYLASRLEKGNMPNICVITSFL